MSNNPTSPKKVVPNSPRTQSTKSHEQSSPRPASVSGTKSVSSPHSRGSTPLRSSPTSKTLTSPGNSTPQRDSTPQRGSTPRKDSTPHRDDISQRSSTPTNKKPVTQVVGDRTTSRNTPVREVPKETKKSVTPEPVNSPRPLSSGFTPINSNKLTARPVAGKTPKLRPVTRTLEPEDTSKPELPLSPKRQVSGDDTKDSNKKSKSASDHSATTTASKTRVTLTPTTSTSSAEKKTVTPKAKVTTTDKAPTSGQAESSENDTAAEETPKIVCENCQAKFHRKGEKDRHDKQRKEEHFLCPVPNCPMREKEHCGERHLKRHHKEMHKGIEFKYEGSHKCPFQGCNKGFTSKNLLDIHYTAKHEKTLICDFCGCGFGARHQLKYHLENQNPYYCNLDHDIDDDDIPDEGLRFCSYKSYSNHHKAEHKGSKIQPRRASKK